MNAKRRRRQDESQEGEPDGHRDAGSTGEALAGHAGDCCEEVSFHRGGAVRAGAEERAGAVYLNLGEWIVNEGATKGAEHGWW